MFGEFLNTARDACRNNKLKTHPSQEIRCAAEMALVRVDQSPGIGGALPRLLVWIL